MEKMTKFITKILEVVLIFLMAAIVIDVVWQIFTRFIMRDPSSYTEELAGFLLIWIGLLGASYALYTKAHLGIDILTSKLEGTRRRVSILAIYSLVMLFALFIPVIGGYRLVNITFTLKQVSPAMGIPMGYIYLVLPITGLLMMYYSLMFMINAGKVSAPGAEAVEINPVD